MFGIVVILVIFLLLDNSVQGMMVMSPLKQFLSGSVIDEIRCGSNLQLVIKLENGYPSCVKADHVKRLVSRDWREPSYVIFGCLSYFPSSSISEEKGFLMITSVGGYKEYVLKPGSAAYVTSVTDFCRGEITTKGESLVFADYRNTFDKGKHPGNAIAKFISPNNDIDATFLPSNERNWLTIDLLNVTKFNNHALSETFVIKIDPTSPSGLYYMPISGCPPALLTIGNAPYEGHIALLDHPQTYNCPPL